MLQSGEAAHRCLLQEEFQRGKLTKGKPWPFLTRATKLHFSGCLEFQISRFSFCISSCATSCPVSDIFSDYLLPLSFNLCCLFYETVHQIVSPDGSWASVHSWAALWKSAWNTSCSEWMCRCHGILLSLVMKWILWTVQIFSHRQTLNWFPEISLSCLRFMSLQSTVNTQGRITMFKSS